MTLKMLKSRKLFTFTFNEIKISSIGQRRTRFTLTDEYGTHSSGEIIESSRHLKHEIETLFSSKSSKRPLRVGILCANNYTYLSSILASWFCGATAVTLNRSHPKNLLDFYLNDSECDLLIKSKDELFMPSREIPQLTIDPTQLYAQFRKTQNNPSLNDFFKLEVSYLNYILLVYSSLF